MEYISIPVIPQIYRWNEECFLSEITNRCSLCFNRLPVRWLHPWPRPMRSSSWAEKAAAWLEKWTVYWLNCPCPSTLSLGWIWPRWECHCSPQELIYFIRPLLWISLLSYLHGLLYAWLMIAVRFECLSFLNIKQNAKQPHNIVVDPYIC